MYRSIKFELHSLSAFVESPPGRSVVQFLFWSGTGAHDGIDLPMAHFATVVEDGWPFADIPLLRKTPTPVVVPVAFATPLRDADRFPASTTRGSPGFGRGGEDQPWRNDTRVRSQQP